MKYNLYVRKPVVVDVSERFTNTDAGREELQLWISDRGGRSFYVPSTISEGDDAQITPAFMELITEDSDTSVVVSTGQHVIFQEGKFFAYSTQELQKLFKPLEVSIYEGGRR